MSKQRINEALNAAKAIKQGFDINTSARHKNVELLYTVGSVNRRFEIETSKAVENDSDGKVQILSIQFNQESHIIAAGDSNGRVQLFDVFSGKALDHENSRIIQETNMPAMSVKWHPNYSNILYFTNANGVICSFNRTKLQMNVLAKEKNETNCIDINESAKFLASVGSDSRIRIYDLNNNFENVQTIASSDQNIKEKYTTGKNDIELDENAHTNRLFSIKFDKRHSDIFYTGGWDRNVKIWDRRLPKGFVGSIYGPNICADGLDVKGNFLLTSSWVKKQSLQLWDVRNSKTALATLPLGETPEGEYIYTAKFSDYNNEQNTLLLACGSGTKGVHLIDYEKREHISKLETNNAVYCIDSVYSGSIFACGSIQCFNVGISKA